MNRRISLDGTWNLRWFDGERGVRAPGYLDEKESIRRSWEVQVPGEVHDQLMKLGLLDDPNVELNVLKARWVEETFWLYSRDFTMPRTQTNEKVWLHCEGLDLAATIYINRAEVGRHANYFYPCVIDVSKYLKPGRNQIGIYVESGLFHAMQRNSEGLAGTIMSQLTKRPWLRKPQFSHSWDWSPRLLNVGIHKSVWLEVASVARWESLVCTTEISDDLQSGNVMVRVFAHGLNDDTQKAALRVTVVQTKQVVTIPVEIKNGQNKLETSLAIDAPALWWPVGHGKQPLYSITAELLVGKRTIGSATKKVGFRRVRVKQGPHPKSGTYFIIEVNNKPIFCKGGNFVPADMIMTTIDRTRYQTLVDRALESNCNFLRVWGGGLYESDEFYEICDATGIMVWQEFIFACAKYPATDEHFLADVKREATYQIRRLAHHASLLVWCGNNELEFAAWDWGYEKGVALPDYALYHFILPKLLKEEDPGRYYQPSSPLSPGVISANRDDTGDQHPWSLGMYDTDFRKYRDMICRFPNEGGFLGPTALPTVEACLPANMRTTSSFAWEVHDNSVNFWSKDHPADRMFEQWLGKDIRTLSIEEYVYWGGVIHGSALGEYARNFRRRMFDSSAAIFWMYNDCWPAVRSWTTVDYYLRRTPAFWHVRRGFAPVTVALAREKNSVKVYGINEGKELKAELRCGIIALTGKFPVDTTQSVILLANASTLIAEYDARIWDKLGIEKHVAFALLTVNNAEVARDILILPLFKEMKWPKANVAVEVKDGKAFFRSTTFAWQVCLDLNGELPLADNFFNVFPGIPTVLAWPKSMGKPKILRYGNR